MSRKPPVISNELTLSQARLMLEAHHDLMAVLYVSSSVMHKENARIVLSEMRCDRLFKYALTMVRAAENEGADEIIPPQEKQPLTAITVISPVISPTGNREENIICSLCSSHTTTPRLFSLRSAMDDEVATITSSVHL